jgi:DUF1680 family protein
LKFRLWCHRTRRPLWHSPGATLHPSRSGRGRIAGLFLTKCRSRSGFLVLASQYERSELPIHSLTIDNTLKSQIWREQLPITERNQPTTVSTRDYPIKPVPFTDVHTDDVFWKPRIEINRTVTIPFAFQQCETSGRVELFQRAAAVLRGDQDVDKSAPVFPFDESDVYKVLEGAGYVLSVQPDPELEGYVDRLVELISQAQEPDGYLYTTRTIDPEHPHPWAGSRRWELERVNSHELYNLGHLYEGAVAYWQATGKRKILDVASKSADLLVRTFGPDKESIWPGHQITEMALVKLARATGDERYLQLAKFLLDQRGPDGLEGSLNTGSPPGRPELRKQEPAKNREYNQSHMHVLDQTSAVGHAVRAMYLYSGMADVAAVMGEPEYIRAIDRIWEDVVTGKLYITGGLGARHEGEAFGNPYELPNRSAYCETCAAIGSAYWNHRLFLLHGDAKYIDVLERTLYNGILSGVALDGMSFFYANPLESEGGYGRSPWFACACCPSNVTRFIASLPGYIYAQQGDTLFVNLYVGGIAHIDMEGERRVNLVQETRFPWEGEVKLTITPDAPGTFTIKVRIPGWARGEAVPSDLYHFMDKGSADGAATLKVNGQPVHLDLDKGYVTLTREWQAEDIIDLYFPMPIRRAAAHEQVEADRGRVALQRGPIVYCLEGIDNKDEHVHAPEGTPYLVLPDDAPLRAEFDPDLLGGVVTIKGQALGWAGDEAGRVSNRAQDFTAVPYYSWANRGAGEMVVWIPRGE